MHPGAAEAGTAGSFAPVHPVRPAVPGHLRRLPGAVREERGVQQLRRRAGRFPGQGGAFSGAGRAEDSADRLEPARDRASRTARCSAASPSGSYVYFVHSFFPKPADASIVATRTNYGETFASSVWRDNVFATQFHPEKSQKVGLQLLKNFVDLVGFRCPFSVLPSGVWAHYTMSKRSSHLVGQTSAPDSRLRKTRGLAPLLIALLLAFGTGCVFYPVLGYDYTGYDDLDFAGASPQVQRGLTTEGVAWAFRATQTANWHPVTWLSLMLDTGLFGPGPWGHHLMNLGFHVGNTVLLLILFREWTGALWRSALVAALFAVHPLHVESVAWISERKDVLSAFWGFLALWAYGRYARAKESRTRRRYYWLAWSLFALGLMSKPMLVTLPFVFLLLDFWPLRRWPGASAKEFFTSGRKLVSGEDSVLSADGDFVRADILVQQQVGDMRPLANFPVHERLANVPAAYVRYLGKTFWPTDLCVLYPLHIHWEWWQVLVAAGVACGFVCRLFVAGTAGFFFVTGWFWFLGTLIPVIGLVQVGEQSMADRYTFCSAGRTVCAVELVRRRMGEAPAIDAISVAILAGLLLIACALRTRDQLSYWRNTATLFARAIAVTSGNFVAYNMLGLDFYNQGLIDGGGKLSGRASGRA